MDNKRKDLIFKLVGFIVVFSILSFSFIVPILSCFIDKLIYSFLFKCSIFLCAISGITFLVLLHIWGDLNVLKPEIFPFKFKGFSSFNDYLSDILIRDGYNKQKSVSISDSGILTVFTRKDVPMELDSFVLLKVDELTDEILELSDNEVTNILLEYYNKKIITDKVIMTSIVCVDRITPTFQKLVNDKLTQNLKNQILPIGISFGGKKIYIAKQVDGITLGRYKIQRRYFLDALKLTDNDVIVNTNKK